METFTFEIAVTLPTLGQVVNWLIYYFCIGTVFYAFVSIPISAAVRDYPYTLREEEWAKSVHCACVIILIWPALCAVVARRFIKCQHLKTQTK